MKKSFLLLSFIFSSILLVGCTTETNQDISDDQNPVNIELEQEVIIDQPSGLENNDILLEEDMLVEENDIENTDKEDSNLDLEKQEPVDKTTQIEIIFDDSGSMWGKIGGIAKIDIAKKAFGTVVDMFSKQKNTEIGLRVYGHQNKECDNSVLEVAIGENNIESIKNIVDGLSPLGYTPITYSLEQSAKDFDQNKVGDKVVVLVTDGIESCNGDPCAAAKALQDAGVVTKVHVVGFGMKKSELDSLKCITQPSSGLLIGANNAQELQEGFDKIVEQVVKYNLELRAKDGDGKYVLADYEIYSSDNPTVQIDKGDTSLDDKALLALDPGTYDIKISEYYTKKDIWIKNVVITDTEKTQKEVVFAQTTLHLEAKQIGTDNSVFADIYVYDESGEEVVYIDTSLGYADITVEAGIYDIKAISYDTKEELWLRGFDMTKGGKISKEIRFK